MTYHDTIKRQQHEQLALLIEYFGSQKMTAHKLGVSQAVVSNWVARGRISATCAIAAEAATGGYVTKESLRPDVLEWK